MRDQDASLASRDIKDVRIRNPFELAVGGGSEINRGLASPDRNNNSVMDVSVRLEPDQRGGSVILAWARSSFSQRAGSASDNGIVLASNSRALSSKYLSTPVL